MIKWVGPLASIMLAVLWLGSYWRSPGVAYDSARVGQVVGVYVEPGVIGVTGWAGSDRASRWLWRWAGVDGMPTRWWFFCRSVGKDFDLVVPIWFPLALTTAASVGAWRVDRKARALGASGGCPRCRYDRAGLEPTAACPECGARPA